MFEKFLHQTPFVKFLFPLIVGILLKIKLPIIPCSIWLLSFILIIIILIQILRLSQSFIWNRIWSAIVFTFILLIGYHLTELKEINQYNYKAKPYKIIATVIENPVEKEKSIKTVLKINSVYDSSNWISIDKKVLCYFEKDSANNIDFGDQIYTTAYINHVKNSGNPNTFNYKRYLKYKDILFQTYIKRGSYKLLAKNNGNRLLLFSNNLRQKLLSIYKSNNINDDEFAVLAALTLGYKTDLTPELKESYSTSGAMHILAVSGLHVGILFIILGKLLFFLNKRKYGKILLATITILVLFFYAVLTGLSSSVIRATIMFSFICIGNAFKRQSNIYNSIFASAFLMLIINPYTLMDVGFQLSYLAVLSIVYFQPKIYSLFNPRFRATDYVWQLVSVAIAAQLGTFPITVYYFEQFPVYFILSNILIIPLVSFIIYGAILLFIFSFSDIIASIIAQVLNFITWLLNTNVNIIESLPYSKIDNINLSRFGLILLCSFILIIVFFIIKKRISYVKYALLLLIVFIGNEIYINTTNSSRSSFIVYNIPKQTAFDFIQNKNSSLFTDFNQDIGKNHEFNILPLHNNLGINRINQFQFSEDDSTLNPYLFENLRILNIRDNRILNYKTKRKQNIDYLIISQNINFKISELTDLINFKKIIFDSSNSFYQLKKWKKECKNLNISYHSVIDDGAFVLDI